MPRHWTPEQQRALRNLRRIVSGEDDQRPAARAGRRHGPSLAAQAVEQYSHLQQLLRDDEVVVPGFVFLDHLPSRDFREGTIWVDSNMTPTHRTPNPDGRLWMMVDDVWTLLGPNEHFSIFEDEEDGPTTLLYIYELGTARRNRLRWILSFNTENAVPQADLLRMAEAADPPVATDETANRGGGRAAIEMNFDAAGQLHRFIVLVHRAPGSSLRSYEVLSGPYDEDTVVRSELRSLRECHFTETIIIKRLLEHEARSRCQHCVAPAGFVHQSGCRWAGQSVDNSDNQRSALEVLVESGVLEGESIVAMMPRRHGRSLADAAIRGLAADMYIIDDPAQEQPVALFRDEHGVVIGMDVSGAVGAADEDQDTSEGAWAGIEDDDEDEG